MTPGQEQLDAVCEAVLETYRWANRDKLTDAVHRVTGRRVSTFMSANHVAQGVFAELFFLEPVPAAV